MSSVAAIAAAGTIYGAVSSADSSRKAINAQKDAAKAAQIDIDALNEQTKTISRQNALDSAALEKQLNPEVPLIRTAANQAVLGGIAKSPQEQQSMALLQSALANGGNAPLLQEAIAKARSNLALGGKLDAETQNAVTRSGIANAGAVAGAQGGVNLGRDVVARDLGLTSLQLENQRLAQALGAGGQEQQGEQLQLQRMQMLQGLDQAGFGRAMAAGQYGESIRQPNVGLDPTAIANLKVGNSNANSAALSNQANIYGRQSQNYMQTAGQGFGTLMAMNKYARPATAAYTTPASNAGYGLLQQPTFLAGSNAPVKPGTFGSF